MYTLKRRLPSGCHHSKGNELFTVLLDLRSRHTHLTNGGISNVYSFRYWGHEEQGASSNGHHERHGGRPIFHPACMTYTLSPHSFLKHNKKS